MSDLIHTISAPHSCKVFTSDTLARAIIRRLDFSLDDTWLEPSVGPGAFLAAIAELGVEREKVWAFEIDRNVCQYKETAQVFEGVDFIEWAQNNNNEFDIIVGNPPFIPLHRLPESMKNAAYNTTFNGKKIRKSVNYWYVFLCSMLKNLKTGGNLGVILPASWDYADYNLSMREYLPSQFRSFEVFRSQNPLFKGVGDGSVVIIGKGYKKSHKINNRFECNDYNTLIESLNNKECLMQAVHLPKKLNTNKTIETIQFRDIADVHIGAVTGDVAYFLFKEKDIRENNLPIEAFLPILSRANHLMTPDMTPEYWNQLREKSERLWLFYPNNNIIHDPNVQRYLNLPKIDGGCNRDAYQVKKRTTWYLVNIPTKADGFISGMSNTQPFITINSIPSLIASNTLYIVNFHENSLIYKYSWSLSLLTSISQESIELNSRIYGGGLKKHEPKDILNTIIPIMKEDENAKSDYIIACNAFVNGDKDTARKIADSYIK